MPIITEIVDDIENSSVGTSQGKTKNVKKWMHLNHILNCKSISCKTYKMVQSHLVELHKINNNDIIVIPVDYHLGSYSDAILTIVCANSENCNVCLRLLDHLSCHKRYCDCNNYKEICYHQLHLRRAVEKFPISTDSLNKYNIECSIPTKEKIKNLGKYHYEVVRVMQGLKDTTQVTDNSGANEENSRKKSSTKHTSRRSKKKNKFHSFSNVSATNNGGGETTINSTDNEIVPYRPVTSESDLDTSDIPKNAGRFIFSDEDFIGSSEDESDFDQSGFTCFTGNLGNARFVHNFETASLSSSSSVSFGMFANIDSNSSSDLNIHQHNHKNINDVFEDSSTDCLDSGFPSHLSGVQGCRNYNHSNSAFSALDSTEDTDYIWSSANNSYKFSRCGRKSQANSDLIFSDESFVDSESDSCCDEEHIHQNFSKKSHIHSKARKSTSIKIPLFSDESLIAYSDDSDEEIFGFPTETSSNFNSTRFTTGSDESSFNGFQNRSEGVVIVEVNDSEVNNSIGRSHDLNQNQTSSCNLENTSEAIATSSSQDTSGIASQSTDTTSNKETENLLGTPSYSSEFCCIGDNTDCWYCGIKDSVSKSETFSDISLPHDVSISSNKQDRKQKKSFRKNHKNSPKAVNNFKKKSKSNPTFHRNLSKNKREMNGKMNTSIDIPSTSNFTVQDCSTSKVNGTKSSLLGDINYSYVRNVLSQQNARSGSNKIPEKRKNQINKSTPRKNKKKMKLYDTSTWIESSNYFQLCHSNMKRC